MSAQLRAVLAVAGKDLRSEWRGRELVASLAQFSVLALLIANFGFDLDPASTGRVAPGILWLVLVFAGLVAFGRSFAVERDQESLEALLLAPVSPAAVLAGKAVAAAAMLALSEAVLLVGMALFFGTPLASGPLLAAVLLATVGMAAVGTVFAALTVQLRSRELLLPVLALPLWIPFVVAGGRAVQVAMGDAQSGGLQALALLADFDILFVIAALLAGRYVLNE